MRPLQSSGNKPSRYHCESDDDFETIDLSEAENRSSVTFLTGLFFGKRPVAPSGCCLDPVCPQELQGAAS